jgi:hypothetical protein
MIELLFKDKIYFRIFRDQVILENTKSSNYETKKVRERLRHNLKKYNITHAHIFD